MQRMARRAIGALAAVALVAASLSTTGLAAPASVNNLGLKTIPFRVINNTGRSGRLYLYVVGLVPSQGHRAYFLSNVNGDVTIVPKQDPPGISLGLDLGTAMTTNLQLPQLEAARIYFSIGQGLKVYAGAAGAPPSSPPGWVPQDPNFNTSFDWAEFTWLDDPPVTGFVTTIGINATQVDMWGIAMLLALKGSNDARTVVTRKSGFSSEEARAKVFRDLTVAGAPWKKLIIGGGKVPLRAIAPYHGIALGLFPADFLQDYIDQVWQQYKTQKLVAMVDGHTYNGSVVNGELVFTDMGGGDPPFKFVKPTTKAAYENALPAIPCVVNTPPCDRAGAIGARLGAGFMRTTLLAFNDLKACVVSQFYRNAPINVYAQLFHQVALGHLAYSFGFDDTCEQSSFIQIHNPQMLTITLQKF